MTTVDKVLPAIANVKKELGAVMKKTNNPFFKSKYADLNTYLDEVEPLLAQNGLMLLQPVTTVQTPSGLENVVASKIIHIESGQIIESSMKLVGGSDMQKLGSGVTYARRYTLGALLSMKAEDDDGNHASSKEKPTTVAKPADRTVVAAKPTVTTVVTQADNAATPVTPAARPSFRKPAKPAAEAPKAAPAPKELVSQGDDI